jgi:hypothetical protein
MVKPGAEALNNKITTTVRIQWVHTATQGKTMICMKVHGEGDDVFDLDLLKAVGVSNKSTKGHVNLGLRNAGNQQWAFHR